MVTIIEVDSDGHLITENYVLASGARERRPDIIAVIIRPAIFVSFEFKLRLRWFIPAVE